MSLPASVQLGFEPVLAFFTRNPKLILSAHETPDADAIGSEYALCKALQQLGHTVRVLNSDPAPPKFTYMDTTGEITRLTDESQLPDDLDDYSFVLLDVNDTGNIGLVADLVLPRMKEMMIIDHHESEEDIPAGSNCISKSASSTCEILHQLFAVMGVEITPDMAEAMYMGIVFDTGCFIYPKTTALTFDVARDLVARGVQPNFTYSKLYESNSVGALVLQAKVGASLELLMDDHIAVQTMLKETVLASGARYEEADQVINTPLKSEAVRVSVFFKENLEGIMRCSMRSKGNINVADIAQSFGGGGHRTAAGFKCRAPIDEVKAEILEKLSPYFA